MNCILLPRQFSYSGLLSRKIARPAKSCSCFGYGTNADENERKNMLWKDPFKHALPAEETTFSEFREAHVDWDFVKRLLPLKTVPELPYMDGEITPSGWRSPRGTAADLPYYIKRAHNHLPAIYLERRRDELNPKTMDFEYVELVTLTGIQGDVFACERELRAYLQERLQHPISTHIDELKGKIRIKGADRTLVEQFVYDCEEEFNLTNCKGK